MSDYEKGWEAGMLQAQALIMDAHDKLQAAHRRHHEIMAASRTLKELNRQWNIAAKQGPAILKAHGGIK